MFFHRTINIRPKKHVKNQRNVRMIHSIVFVCQKRMISSKSRFQFKHFRCKDKVTAQKDVHCIKYCLVRSYNLSVRMLNFRVLRPLIQLYRNATNLLLPVLIVPISCILNVWKQRIISF